MKNYILFILFAVVISSLSAQNVRIANSAGTADASAMLDIVSDSKGILIPRLTTTNRDGISSPATGLMIYNITENTFQFYDGSVWVDLGGGAGGATPTGLEQITEGSNTGWRLIGSNAANHGDIGTNALDLSYSSSASTINGATGDFSFALGFNTKASGSTSVAMGDNTKATGALSFASGLWANAPGYISFAHGLFSYAPGLASTAMGQYTTASGDYSTSMGSYTKAESFSQMVIGQYNTSHPGTPNATSSVSTDRLFVIGNGTSSSSRSDAMVMLKNGNTTLNGQLTLSNGSSSYTLPNTDGSLSGQVLTTDGSGSVTWASIISASGLERITEGGNTGWRLMGSIAANYGNIGSKAVDLSFSDLSSSIRGATGNYSTATGYRTQATGDASTAMGCLTTASGNASTAMGQSTTASGYLSTAMGFWSEASGTYSTAMGFYTTAKSYVETVIGTNNTDYTPSSSGTTSWNASDRLFVIGNGSSSSAKSDALIVFKNGNATLQGTLTQNSDRRLKANILPISSALSNVLQLGGYSYHWKDTDQRGNKKQIGLIAQEVEALYPELVSKNGQGILSVNYNGLIPVLIESTKEQQAIIESQNDKIDKQTTEIDKQNEEIALLKAQLAASKAKQEQEASNFKAELNEIKQLLINNGMN